MASYICSVNGAQVKKATDQKLKNTINWLCHKCQVVIMKASRANRNHRTESCFSCIVWTLLAVQERVWLENLAWNCLEHWKAAVNVDDGMNTTSVN